MKSTHKALKYTGLNAKEIIDMISHSVNKPIEEPPMGCPIEIGTNPDGTTKEIISQQMVVLTKEGVFPMFMAEYEAEYGKSKATKIIGEGDE